MIKLNHQMNRIIW